MFLNRTWKNQITINFGKGVQPNKAITKVKRISRLKTRKQRISFKPESKQIRLDKKLNAIEKLSARKNNQPISKTSKT